MALNCCLNDQAEGAAPLRFGFDRYHHCRLMLARVWGFEASFIPSLPFHGSQQTLEVLYS